MSHALRVLAAPVSVLSLMVLVLNDHVLKQAWPGLVTGKLSDVAGLVVAPLLLAVLLALMGVRRALPVAIGLTGLGFVFAKTSVAGAAATSAVWSLTGIPTLIRADVTDLVALPALGVAWWVDQRVRCSAREPWRRTVAVATGMAVLPVAVLGTAATSWSEDVGLTHVSRVEGDFPGRPRALEQRLSIGELFGSDYTIDDGRMITDSEVELSNYDETVPEQCDPTDPARCWRIAAQGAGGVQGVTVEHTADAGVSWTTELEVTQDDAERMLEDYDDSCGTEPTIVARDLAVLPTDGEPVVVLPVGRAGAFIREEDARWQLYSTKDFYDIAWDNRTEPPRPQVTPVDQPSEDPPPGQSGPGGATLTCPSPTPTTVTPHPSNGPPTTYLTCP